MLKFIDDKTNREIIVNYEHSVLESFCHGVRCETCKIKEYAGMGCSVFVIKNPQKAANLMGYRYIKNNESNSNFTEWNSATVAPSEYKEYLVCTIYPTGNGGFQTGYAVIQYKEDKWDTDEIVVAWRDFDRFNLPYQFPKGV